jgi:preprotein translocase subunit SecB
MAYENNPADGNNPASGIQAASQNINQGVFNIQRVYLKDLSLEQPNSPQIFLETDTPAVDVQIGIEAAPIGEGVFEVIVTGTVTTKIKDKTAFLVEAKQAGIFEISNFPNEQANVIVAVACPQILYPYLRANIADAITRASFPPIQLTELNFQAMYEQRLAHEAQAAQGNTTTATVQ